LDAPRSRELTRAGALLSGELGLSETKLGARVEGVYLQRIDLVRGHYAVVARGRNFTLIPWRATYWSNVLAGRFWV
jgi:hypothetical protein